MILITYALVFLLSLALTVWLSSPDSPLRVLDMPNDRSLHVLPVARTGGLAILASVLLGWGALVLVHGYPAPPVAIVLPVVLIAVVSFVDDLMEVSALIRLLVHGGAGLLLLFLLPAGMLDLLGMILVWLIVVWLINLYNFMDGMDGFAGGMGFFGFAFLGLVSWLSSGELLALLAWVISVANLGFVVRNFPPADIFMGDVGSTTMGLLAALLSLWGVAESWVPWWAALLIFSPFIADATVTLIRRLLKGEKVWQAHCSHYYQRLVKLGWGHRRTVLAEYGLMLGAGGSTVLIMKYPIMSYEVLLGSWVLIYLLIAFFISFMEHSRL